MALARTNRLGSNSGTGIGTASHTTTSFTPSSNSVLVVCVVDMTDDTSGDTSTELTVSGGGWTYNAELNEGKTLSPADFALNMRVWTAQVATGASMTLTFDHGARSVHRYVYSVFDYTGAHASDPGGQTGILEAGPTTGAGTLNLGGAPDNGSEVIGILASDTGDGSTPGTGWTEIHDVQALGDAGIETEVKAAAPTAPVYASQGAGVITEASGGALSPLAPATVTAGQLLIIFAYYEGTTTTPDTPSEFTLLDGPRTLASSVGRCWVFGKIADGDEDGAAQALGTPAVTTMRAARCYSFNNVRSDTVANVVGGFGFDGPASSATVNDVGVTTPEDNCLAVNLVTVADDNAVADFTGETGGDWIEAVAQYTSTATTPDYCQQIQTAAMPTAGTINGGSQTMAASDPFGVVGFYIRGNSANSASVDWVNVDPGTANATMLLGLEIKQAGGGDATASPDVIARSFTTPAPTVSVGAAPAVVARSFTIPAPAVSVGAAPAVIARSTVHPQVAVSVGAAPAVIARAFTVPQALAGESSVVTPAVIARAFALDQVAVSVGAAPAVIARSFVVPQATPDGGVALVIPRAPVLVFDEAIRRARFLRLEWPQALIDLGPPIEAVSGDATPTPAAIALAFSVPQVAVSVGAAPAVMAFGPIVNQATVSVGAAPATVVLAFVMPPVTVVTPDAMVSPALIALAFSIPSVTIDAEFFVDKPWKLLGGGSVIRMPQKYPTRRAGWN